MLAGTQDLDFLDRQPVEGQSLADRLAAAPPSAEEALQFAIEIGGALHKAHARGMVHGALSPRSIRIAGGRAVVLQPPLHPGAETAAYRAPEQVRGDRPDSRSDVFAFGAILYEMVAGTPAFHGEGQALNRSILNDPAPTLTLRSPIHDAIAAVVAGCLEKLPAARRQRIQNAVTELRFASKGPSTPKAERAIPAQPKPVLVAPSPVSARPRPAEPPRSEQFLFKPDEPVLLSRPDIPQAWWKDLFGRERMWPFSDFRMRLAAFIAVCLIVVAGAAVFAVMFFRPKTGSPVLRFAVNTPENTTFPGSPVISPDGRNLAFSAQGPDGRRALWLRPLDASRNTLISGTEGATSPFWSPDGQSLAYFAQRSLRIIRLKDNAAETVCKVEGINGGGTWNQDGVILFSRGQDDGLYRVAAKANSTPSPVLSVDSSKNETGYLWPQFLPDGKRFLFFVQSESPETTGVYTGILDNPSYRLLFSAETNAVYSPLPDSSSQKNGYLLYINGRKLMGRSFNAARLELAGEAITLADDVGPVRSLSLAPISVAGNATLVYQSTGRPTRQLAWLDRMGNEVVEAKEAGEWGPPRLSPDGKRAVAAKLGVDGENAHLWFVEADGAVLQIDSAAAHEGSPVWSPDGSRIVSFISGKQEGNYDLYARAAQTGARPDLLFRSAVPKYPTDWSRDGRYIFFNAVNEGTRYDVWALSTADRHAGPILESVHTERDAVLSPDGKWLAFDSDESGQRLEVYVIAFDGINASARRHWKVSAGGGGLPKWRSDSKELFFISAAGRMMSAAIHPAGNEFDFDPPVKLFQTRPVPKTWNFFEPSPDGQRFLVNLPLEWANSSPIMVVTNWTEKIRD